MDMVCFSVFHCLICSIFAQCVSYFRFASSFSFHSSFCHDSFFLLSAQHTHEHACMHYTLHLNHYTAPTHSCTFCSPSIDTFIIMNDPDRSRTQTTLPLPLPSVDCRLDSDSTIDSVLQLLLHDSYITHHTQIRTHLTQTRIHELRPRSKGY